MANIKIAQLTAKTTLADTDLVIIESATQTQKMTVATLKSLLGINNGGIMESGSTPEGKYIKYFDGTLIVQRNVVIANLPVTTANGGVFMSTSLSWQFPATFFEPPSIQMSAQGTGSAFPCWVATTLADSGGITYYRILSPTAITGAMRVSQLAIGRWKA